MNNSKIDIKKYILVIFLLIAFNTGTLAQCPSPPEVKISVEHPTDQNTPDGIIKLHLEENSSIYNQFELIDFSSGEAINEKKPYIKEENTVYFEELTAGKYIIRIFNSNGCGFLLGLSKDLESIELIGKNR